MHFIVKNIQQEINNNFNKMTKKCSPYGLLDPQSRKMFFGTHRNETVSHLQKKKKQTNINIISIEIPQIISNMTVNVLPVCLRICIFKLPAINSKQLNYTNFRLKLFDFLTNYLPLWLKLFSHCVHLYGFSNVCFRIWIVRFPVIRNAIV